MNKFLKNVGENFGLVTLIATLGGGAIVSTVGTVVLVTKMVNYMIDMAMDRAEKNAKKTREQSTKETADESEMSDDDYIFGKEASDDKEL